LSSDVELAERAARAAGRGLMGYYGRAPQGLGAKTSVTDPVSDADCEAERAIQELLRRERPGDGLLAEEGSRAEAESGRRWIVDPLDGTVNFLYRIPIWTVSVAIEDDAGAVAGVIHDPNQDDTFTALRGGGAELNGHSITVSSQEDLAQALIGTGFAYDARIRAVQAEVVHRLLPQVRDVRRAGSAALDLASLACGRLDGFYEAHMEVWDRAAGVLIATEAGAKVTDLEPPLGRAIGVVAANPSLHDQLRPLVV
jgi:myo-inositol-1(or 4)-monophosphatase